MIWTFERFVNNASIQHRSLELRGIVLIMCILYKKILLFSKFLNVFLTYIIMNNSGICLAFSEKVEKQLPYFDIKILKGLN